jgi:hypothetical protein
VTLVVFLVQVTFAYFKGRLSMLQEDYAAVLSCSVEPSQSCCDRDVVWMRCARHVTWLHV